MSMAGATSLVELILKKWGDDIAGAAKELEQKVGFPESVANRIASGELPMDPASVEARWVAQGYGDELYHGSTHDITEFNGQGNPSNDWGQGTYLTDDTWDASTNYAGEGPDLTNKIQHTKEQLADEITDRVRYSEDLNETLLDIQDEYGLNEHDMAKVRGWADDSGLISFHGGVYMPDHPEFLPNEQSENLLASALTNTIARKQVKGGNEGVIYPVRVKQEGLLNVTDEVELPDYNAQAADELGYDYDKFVNEEYDEDVLLEIEERGYDLQAEDYDSPNAAMFSVGNELDTDMSYVESIYEGDTWNDVRNKLGDAVVYTDEGDVIGSGGVTAEVMSRGGATGVVDEYAPSRFPSMGAGRHTIMFPGSENQIRSVNAAFDPEYKGSNIMGGLALPVAAGLLAAGQSEDADAGFITKGGKTLLEAWHGSPHKFDRFSMDQIGTGEGAQAYGHGLYFADSEDVARQYRDALSLNGYQDNNANYSKALELGLSAGEFDAFESMVRGGATRGGNSVETLAPMLQKHLQWPDEHLPSIERFVGEYLDTLPKGSLYRTEIDVTPESLLDWDKPLSEQPQAVQEIAKQLMPELSSTEMQYIPNHGEMTHWTAMADSLEKIPAVEKAIAKLDPYHQGRFAPYGDEMMSTMTGEKFYNSLASPGEWDRQVQGLNRGMTRGEETSGLLSDRGIKGIKYLDGDSRAVGDGTSNYVIFDDSLINIAERGNATVPMLATTAGLSGAGLLAASLAKPEVKDSGMISAPRSETLFDLTMGARDLERRLEGSPASLLFPSGLVEYLETVNRREENPNAMTRGMALLDVIP